MRGDKLDETRDSDDVLRIEQELDEHLRRGEPVDIGWVIDRHPDVLHETVLTCRVLDLLDELRKKHGLPSSDRVSERRTPLSPSSQTQRPPPEDSPLPKRIGEFRILRLLGVGGMGIVLLAEQEHLRRLVALKVLPTTARWRPGFVERFWREMAHATRVRHPNVAQVYTGYRDEEHDIHFYAMEYVDGETLRDRAAKLRARLAPPDASDSDSDSDSKPESSPESASGPPSSTEPNLAAHRRQFIEELLDFVIQAARAVHAVHEAGILHRDVKPENLLVSKDGVLKLVDFGLARADDDVTLTRSGDTPGTPHYMSPELLLGKRRPDRRSDVYSLGVVLYEGLTGEVPRAAGDFHDLRTLALRVQLEEPPPPRKKHPWIHVDLETIALKALERSPDRRYATALELAQDLERILRFEPIHARRAGVVDRARKFTYCPLQFRP